MAWSQVDLDTLRAALVAAAGGPQRIRYADGREVTYNSPDQVSAAIKVVDAALKLEARATAGFVRKRFGVFRSGL